MAKRREFEIALVAILSATLTGCAGKSILPSWSSKSSSADSSQAVQEYAAKNSSSSSSIGSGLKKTGSAISDALTIKPKVTPAEDATSLNSKPVKLGPDIYISGARVHETRGNHAAAADQYRKALELAPKDMGALVGLARLYDRQGQFADAEKLYKQASEVDPKSALVANDLGLCYARQKRLDEATVMLTKATELQPQNPMYRNNMATVLVEQGRIDEAWAQLAVVSEPAVAHYNLAFLLHKREHDELAAQHLQQALAANPQLTAAQQLLAQIRSSAGIDSGELAEMERGPAPSYSISDEVPNHASNLVAASHGGQLVNPLAPSGRRSATYRMPPTEEQTNDPAPPPAMQIPASEPEPVYEQGPEITLEAPAPPTYRARRTAHVTDDGIRQPGNVIRLLGSEPMAAPIPVE